MPYTAEEFIKVCKEIDEDIAKNDPELYKTLKLLYYSQFPPECRPEWHKTLKDELNGDK